MSSFQTGTPHPSHAAGPAPAGLAGAAPGLPHGAPVGGHSAPASAALGNLITERAIGGLSRVVGIIALLIVIALCALGGVAAVGGIMRGSIGAIFGLIVAAMVAFACVMGIRNMFRRVAFHEGGMVDTLFARRREFMYHDVAELSYSLTRQYVNGAYAGTNAHMRLKMLDGRAVSWGGRYNEKLVGRGFFKAGRFEGSDPLDAVRSVISFHISTRLTESLARGQTVVWPGAAALSVAGMTPLRGRRKGMLVPWNQVAGISMDKGIVHVFAEGDQKSFLDVMAGAANTFPCLEVVSSLIGGGEGMPVSAGAAALDGGGSPASTPGAPGTLASSGPPISPDGMARKANQYAG